MSAAIPFRRDMDFEYGVIEDVAPMIRRIIARNPGPFTFHGTGTYIVGRGRVAVIDPGPDLADHVAAMVEGLRGEEITHILVTHTHRDHSPACRPLQRAKGGTTYGYGPHGGGKIDAGFQVEEGGDMDFAPDVRVGHGEVIEGDGWSFDCVHTPGHTSNHVCFALREERVLFSGDHVMGWSTTVISPPDGDMTDYMASLGLLLQRDDARYWPTHGLSIDDPKPFVRAFIAHREQREAQVLACLAGGLDTIQAMVPEIYNDISEALLPAAARSLFATVIHLVGGGKVVCEGALSVNARYALTGP